MKQTIIPHDTFIMQHLTARLSQPFRSYKRDSTRISISIMQDRVSIKLSIAHPPILLTPGKLFFSSLRFDRLFFLLLSEWLGRPLRGPSLPGLHAHNQELPGAQGEPHREVPREFLRQDDRNFM